MTKPKFQLGQTLATPGALKAMEEAGQYPGFFLDRHIQAIGERSAKKTNVPTTRRWWTAPGSYRRIPHAQG